MVVEDDPNDVLLLYRAFQKTGLKNPLQVMRDGQEAIDYLSHQGKFTSAGQFPLPALVLLDLNMPRKNGFEVLEWLRQQPALKRLSVVVFTASSEIADIERAYDLGANSYVVKPTNDDTLIAVVQQLHSYWLRLNEKPRTHPMITSEVTVAV